ncbi:MAG: ankyrin repeat domain-containing protein [Fimbriimonas sp.]
MLSVSLPVVLTFIAGGKLAPNDHELTPLQMAIEDSNLKQIRKLAKVDGCWLDGGKLDKPPLIFALEKPKLIPHLLKLGAKLDVKDRRGNSVAHYILGHIYPPPPPGPIFLNHTGRQPGPLNPEALLLELTPKGLPLELPNQDNVTPLMLAAENHLFDAVVLLLKQGARINETDEDGKTPLMYAVEGLGIGFDISTNEDLKTIRYLLERGADPKPKDKQGRTALDRAKNLTRLSLPSSSPTCEGRAATTGTRNS